MMKDRFWLKLRGLAIWVMFVALVMTAAAQQPRAAFNVSITTDSVDVTLGDGNCADSNGACSLRAAIMEANTLAGADTISIPAGTYTLTIAGTGENLAQTGDLDITSSLTINGAGAGTTIINGGGLDAVFHVDPVNFGQHVVTINGLTVTNAISSSGSEAVRLGGSTVTLSNCTVNGNNSTGVQVNNGTTTISNCTISANRIGVENYATLTINGGSVSSNVTDGIYSQGTLTVTSVQIADNGEDGVELLGTSTLNSAFINENGDQGIVNSAIATTTVNEGFIGGHSDNFFGGGIINDGTLTLIDTNVSENSANYGGGIFNTGSLTIMGSVLFENVAEFHGGGIYNASGFLLTIKNTTFSANEATGNGGAIWNTEDLDLNNVTLTLNTAVTGGGIFDNATTGNSIIVNNTIIAGNIATTGADCAALEGVVISEGYNLVGNITGCPGFAAIGDLTAVNPLLGVLADNGGSTQTHALQTSSPAIGAGNTDTCEVTDQRGEARGIACDIGAFEFDLFAPTELLVNGNFEIDTDTDTVPDNWIPTRLTGDKVRCNTATKTFAYKGLCAFIFKGSAGENSRLSQDVDLAALSPVELNVGDTLELVGFINAKGAANTAVKVTVTYADTTKAKINAKTTAATTGWQPLPGTLTLDLTQNVTAIKVNVQNRGTSGKVSYDALSLRLTNDVDPRGNSNGVIPLPLPQSSMGGRESQADTHTNTDTQTAPSSLGGGS